MELIVAAEQLEASLAEEKRMRAHSCLGCPGDDCGVASRHQTLYLEEIPANRKALREAIAAEKVQRPFAWVDRKASYPKDGFRYDARDIPERFDTALYARSSGKTLAMEKEPFESVAAFEKRGLDNVSVKIRYKGATHPAWYYGGRFYFNVRNAECYLTECITGVRV